MDRYCLVEYQKDKNGAWVRYEEAAIRIADLEAQLAALTAERDSLKQRLADERELHYKDHVTISSLHEQLAAMTDERDSETRWAKQYSDEANELRQQLTAAQ